MFPEGDFRDHSIQQVVSPAAGLILNLHVQVGDEISEGQVIAEILPEDNGQRENAIEESQQQLAAMTREHELLTGLEQRLYEQQQRENAAQLRSLQNVIQGKENNLVQLRAIADNKNSLANSGVITRDEALQSESAITAVESEIASYEHELSNLPLILERLALQNERSFSQRESEISQLEGRLASMASNLRATQLIHSVFSGEIIQISSPEGARLERGQRVALLDNGGDSKLRIQGYVSLLSGKNISAGMPVQISPSSVKREEFGYLLGNVSAVAEYPEDASSIDQFLNDSNLSQQITSSIRDPLQIDIALAEGTDAQQYQWSTSKNPPQKLSVGTYAEFSVLTASKKPIELVIPYIREKLGF